MLLLSPRTMIVLFVSFLFLFAVLHSYSSYSGQVKEKLKNLASQSSSKWTYSHSSTAPTGSSDLGSSIRKFFAPTLHGFTEEYVDPAGNRFYINSTAWTQPMGKRVLVVDMDTRKPDGENQILSKARVDYDNNQFSDGGNLVSNGIFDHYLWAQIHGYDYKYYQATRIPGYHNTWILPHVLHQLLATNQYDFIVSMDMDISVTHPDVPLEFLLNKWGVSPRTSIAVPWDVQEVKDGKPVSVDGKGVQVLNMGLVVVQNLPYTMEMLEMWKDCPSEKVYKGCARWKGEWSHEQRAFSEYIRYDFNPFGDNIVAIPCDDALSFPGMAALWPGRLVSDCNGHFFRHHTINKEKTKDSIATSVMQLLWGMVQDSVRDHQDDLWIMGDKKGFNAP